MQQKYYYGSIKPLDFSNALVAHFNRGNYRVQQIKSDNSVIVQIATPGLPQSGGSTALSIIFHEIEDGVSVEMGEQAWLGVAASLGKTALSVFHNPLNLLGRLDDLAQDIEHLQLSDQIWTVLENTAQAAKASQQLSDRLRRVSCEYCSTANPVGAPNCIACGAPLGNVQPKTCPKCGFIIQQKDVLCPNCGHNLTLYLSH